MAISIVGAQGFGQVTNASGGTVFSLLVPGRVGAITRLLSLTYTPPSNAQVLTCLRPLGQVQPVANLPIQSYTTVSAAAASGQAVVNIAAQPGSAAHGIQANDFVAITESDGIQRLHKVSSVSTLAITLTTNLVTGVTATGQYSVAANNCYFWCFGATGTTDPNSGSVHPQLNVTASTNLVLADDTGTGAGVLATYLTNSPILIQSNNATAQGYLQQVAAAWSEGGY